MPSVTTISHSFPPTSHTTYTKILSTILVPEFIKTIEQRDIPEFINVLKNITNISSAPLVPEIRYIRLLSDDRVFNVDEKYSVIHAGYPNWGYFEAGSQVLARYILDNPDIVRNKRVLDFGCKGGQVAVAAALANASEVIANDIDPISFIVVAMNAELNNVSFRFVQDDLIDTYGPWDVVLAGDTFYHVVPKTNALHWLEELDKEGKTVIIGESGSFSFEPEEIADNFTIIAQYPIFYNTNNSAEYYGDEMASVYMFKNL